MPRMRAVSRERLKWQEMSRSLDARSFWGEEVILSPASPRLVRSPAKSGTTHSAERNRARPARLSQPLSLFSYLRLVCRFRFVPLRLRLTSALVFSHRRPSGNSPRLISFCACPTPPVRAHLTREGQKDSRVRLPRFLNTRHSDQFCHFVLFFLLSRVLRDAESQLHQRHEEVSLLRRW